MARSWQTCSRLLPANVAETSFLECIEAYVWAYYPECNHRAHTRTFWNAITDAFDVLSGIVVPERVTFVALDVQRKFNNRKTR